MNPDLIQLPRFRSAIENIQTTPINEIAWVISVSWEKPYFGAVPYIKAMRQIYNVHDKYAYEDAESVIRYFLANASTWRGDVARLVKKELNNRLKSL